MRWGLLTSLRCDLLRVTADLSRDLRLLQIVADLEEVDTLHVLVQACQQFADSEDFGVPRSLGFGVPVPLCAVGLELLQQRNEALDVQAVRSGEPGAETDIVNRELLEGY
jgi:hypothetical protein